MTLSTEILQNIRPIKLLNWENVFERKIMSIRSIELKHNMLLKIFDALQSIIWGSG